MLKAGTLIRRIDTPRDGISYSPTTGEQTEQDLTSGCKLLVVQYPNMKERVRGTCLALTSDGLLISFYYVAALWIELSEDTENTQ